MWEDVDDTLGLDSPERSQSDIFPSSQNSDENNVDLLNIEIPPSKMVTDRDKDVWDIKALNFRMEPVSRPSTCLDLYMQNHEQLCEDQLDKMHSEMNEVNNRTENCIRNRCENLKITLKDADDTIDNWKRFVSSGKIPLTSVMMTKHNVLNLTKLNELLDTRKTAIDDFDEEVFAIEKRRMKQCADVLRKYNGVLSKLAIARPAIIRLLLETEIMKINQVVLNNVRYYEDLKLNLSLQGEKLERSFRDYIEKCQKKFTLKLMDTLHDRNQQLDPDKEFFDSEEGKNALESLYGAQNLISELLKQQNGQVRYSPDEVDEWTRRIQKAAEELDATAKKVISLYKKTTYNLFQGRISELEKLQDEYNSIENGEQKESRENDTDMEELQRKVFEPLLQTGDTYKRNISEIEEQWRTLMKDMQNTLRETFIFLRDSSRIWDRHFQRSTETKSMINMKLITAVAEHIVYEGNLEKELNIAIDILRQGANETVLINELNKIFDMLRDLESQYGLNYIERIRIVERYNNIMGAETKLLQTEIDKFLELYPNEYYNDYFNRRSLPTHESQAYDSEKPERVEEKTKETQKSHLPQELRKCQYQTDAVRNWKLGLREAIQFYRLVCHKEMDKNMKRWVERQCISMKRDFETKFTIHQTRYQRIKTEIYDLRCAELRTHKVRFQGHKLGVQQQLQNFQEELDDYEKKLTENVEEFERDADEADQISKKSASSVEISSLILKAEKMTDRMNRMFETTLQNYQDETLNKMNWIQTTNMNYLKNIKLFSKGGNFHPDEVHELSVELEKLSKEVEEQGNALRTKAADKQTNIIYRMEELADKLSSGLKAVYDDIQFAEKVSLAILSVRDYIRKEVRHLKYNRKLLSQQLHQLLTEMPISGGLDLISFVKEYWHPLMDGAEQHYTFLLQPTRSRNSSDNTGGDYPPPKVGLRFIGFDSVSTGIKLKPSRAKQTPNQKSNFTDYRELLFDTDNPTLSGTSFMENVCRCLWEVFLALQESAADFYKIKQKSPLVRNDAVKPSYEEFLEETLIRFKYYHLQCEEVWLEEVNEYLTLLNRMQNTSNVFCNQAVEKFHENRRNALLKAHKIFLQKMRRIEKQHSDRRKCLTEKLKPLHGYPGNKQLLDDLEEEMKEAYITVRDETEDHVTQYKEYLEDREHAYRSDLKTLSNKLQKVLDTIFTSPLLAKDLADQAEEVFQGIRRRSFIHPKLSYLKRKKSQVSGETEENQKEMPTKMYIPEKENITVDQGSRGRENSSWKFMESIINSIKVNEGEVPKEYRLRIDQNGQTIETTKEQKINLGTTATLGDGDRPAAERHTDDFDAVKSYAKQLEVHQTEPTDIASLVTSAEEEFLREVESKDEKASTFLSSCNEDTEEWIQQFDANKEKVKELYAVGGH